MGPLLDVDGWIRREELPDEPDAGTWEREPDPDGPELAAGSPAGAAS